MGPANWSPLLRRIVGMVASVVGGILLVALLLALLYLAMRVGLIHHEIDP